MCERPNTLDALLLVAMITQQQIGQEQELCPLLTPCWSNSDNAVKQIIEKVEGMGMVRRTSSVPGLARRSTTAEMGLSPEQAAII